MRKRAFTLIELLVVLAVIAVLAALLVATMQSIHAQGATTVCLSHLRQWGTALNLYANDHNGEYVRRGQGVQTLVEIDRPTDWFNALPWYFGMASFQQMVTNAQPPAAHDQTLFICPAANNPGGTYFLPYGMNMNLCPWNLAVPTKFTEVSQPVCVVTLADAPGPYASTYPSAKPYGIVARHSDQINLLFLAGNVQSFAGPYVGCGTGDPGLADVRWLTGTASDATASNY